MSDDSISSTPPTLEEGKQGNPATEKRKTNRIGRYPPRNPNKPHRLSFVPSSTRCVISPFISCTLTAGFFYIFENLQRLLD